MLLLWLPGIAVFGQDNTSNTPPSDVGSGPIVPIVPERPPIFAQVVPHPTGKNGYEDFVQAGDLIRNNPDVDAALLPTATLAFKRHMVAEPDVMQALHLLRAGLQKPIRSPRDFIDTATLFPELASFRKLARLLKTEQYVDFADGHVTSAIESLRVGLAFAYRVQTDTLISGLVGIAIDAIVTKEFAAHLDQLSALQCEMVMRLVRDNLTLDSPQVVLLQAEKEHLLKEMDKFRSDAPGFISGLNEMSSDDDPDPNMEDLKAYLTDHPKDLPAVIDEAKSLISRFYDKAIADLGLPPSQRKPSAPNHSHTPAALLAGIYFVNPEQIGDRYSTSETWLRQLGLHAAIRRYRWEYNRLPESLAELRADDLVFDPFTGEQMVYTRTGDSYTLESKGPINRDETSPLNGQRIPVTILPRASGKP